MSLIVVFKTVRTYLFETVISLFFMPLALLLSLLPERIRFNRFYYLIVFIWSRLFLFFTFILIKTEGEENFPSNSGGPVIFIMNHTSVLDIPLGEYVVGPRPHLWISKIEYGKIPFFGFLLKRMYVLVDKKNTRKGTLALIRAFKLAKNYDLDIILFPEGTRSVNGEVGEFLNGFAFFARKLKRPIIPVAIKGANKVLPKNSLFIGTRDSTIKLIIGKPIFIKENELEKDFTLRVKEWFENKLS